MFSCGVGNMLLQTAFRTLPCGSWILWVFFLGKQNLAVLFLRQQLFPLEKPRHLSFNSCDLTTWLPYSSNLFVWYCNSVKTEITIKSSTHLIERILKFHRWRSQEPFTLSLHWSTLNPNKFKKKSMKAFCFPWSKHNFKEHLARTSFVLCVYLSSAVANIV